MAQHFTDTGLGAQALGRVFLKQLKTLVSKIKSYHLDEGLAVEGHVDLVPLLFREKHGLRLDQLLHLRVVSVTCVERREPYYHLIG